MAEYNGFPSWEHWNVSLWMHNDEGLYADMMQCKDMSDSPEKAVEHFLDFGHNKTPDGARYTRENLLHVFQEEWKES